MQLMQWSRALGKPLAFGIEGTGSYGAGLTRFLTHEGYTVVEVNRPDRRVRRERGKSDPTDAENAARAVLSGQARAVPKAGDQSVEMIRHVKVARDTAVKARLTRFSGHLMLTQSEVFNMTKKQPVYTPEFRRQMVELRSGRSGL